MHLSKAGVVHRIGWVSRSELEFRRVEKSFGLFIFKTWMGGGGGFNSLITRVIYVEIR